ncbi:MAG TPA: zinc transporter ZupT, partial [Bacteroidales bacterium]|nr:zinc transporter ZupT [Bacteroidales bacterium]
MEVSNVMLAFGLTLLAGLSTGIGSAMAFFAKRTNTRFLSISLGFSAGVMIYVSFVEIFLKARTQLSAEYGDVHGTWITVLSFFGGIMLIALIDRFIPKGENPHEIGKVEDMTE